MSEYLDRINEANDIKKIEPEAYDALASEIRSFIIVSVNMAAIWHPISAL